MRISAGTIARTIILLLALTNQILVSAGKSPIIIQDEQITETVSLLFTIGASILAWWKNNSFSKTAIKADEYREKLKWHGDEDDDGSDEIPDDVFDVTEKYSGSVSENKNEDGESNE